MEEYSKSVPLISFPTKVLFIDDDENFFDIVGNSIDLGENIVFSCLDYKNHVSVINSQNNIIVDEILSSDPYNDPENSDINLNYFDMQNLMLNNYKNNYYSVVFIDYDMPSSNGIDVLKSINNPYIYKVLLTGVADEKMAIKAFSDGIINNYIRKHDINLRDLIIEAIKKGSKYFFEKQTAFLRSKILSNKLKKYALSNNNYIKLLSEYIEKNDVSEYYLVESIGSYVLIQKDGIKKILHICDNDDIASYIEQLADDNINANIIKQVKNGEKILCYYSRGNFSYTKNNFSLNKNIFEARVMDNSNSYYYAFVEAS
jgi:CheY-like chemotaxis protein